MVVGISLNYIFLPMRAAQFPAINEGEPTNWNALLQVLNRAQYGKPPVTYRMADFPSQLGNYLQYFAWQFARDWGIIGMRISMVLFSMLGLIGATALWQRDRRAFWASATLMFTLTLALITYLNFKYGYSYDVDPSKGPVAREVRERDYFFVISFAAFGLWIAVGLRRRHAGRRGGAQGPGYRAARWTLASPLLGLAFNPAPG